MEESIDSLESEAAEGSILGLFSGAQQLWVSFWLYFFIPSAVLNILFFFVILPDMVNSNTAAAIASVLIIMTAIYKVTAWHSVFVCSNNTDEKVLTYCARIVVLIDIYNGLTTAPILFLMAVCQLFGSPQ